MKYMQGEYKIASVNKLTDTVYDIKIVCPEVAAAAKAGQFVNIRCGEKTLRRPISICEIDADEGTIRLVYEVRGEGTRWISEQKAGDKLDLLAPLGNGFPEKDSSSRILFVGGGIGVPPLLQTAKRYSSNACAVLGFRNKSAIILKEDFEKVCGEVCITTDDGSFGHHGFVTDVVKEKLSQGGIDAVYACGPMPMLKGVNALAQAYGVECRVSLEERMGCGIGACLVCACHTKEADGEHHRHVCKNGPVFDGKEVVW